jgi:hypothetical protein
MKSTLALIFLLTITTLQAELSTNILGGVVARVNNTVVCLPAKTPYDAVPKSRTTYLQSYREGYLQAMKGLDASPEEPTDKAIREATQKGFRAGQEAAAANGHKGIVKFKDLKPEALKK